MTGPHSSRLCHVVDDNCTLQRISTRIVEGASMRAIEAMDGIRALSPRRQQQPDCELLNWNTPNCLGAIRHESGDRTPRVILCTTENDPAHVATAIEAGAREVVMKPFEAGIMPSKLDRAMSGVEAWS